MSSLSLSLPDPDATARVGVALADILVPGDVILLEGPVGAGKTHLARSLIQSILTVPEDVPSPTFTLVQVYDTERGPLWHADLYRLTGSEEIEELGLTEAFDTAICLIEWPDRLGEKPDRALTLSLTSELEGRNADLHWSSTSDWGARLKQGVSNVTQT